MPYSIDLTILVVGLTIGVIVVSIAFVEYINRGSQNAMTIQGEAESSQGDQRGQDATNPVQKSDRDGAQESSGDSSTTNTLSSSETRPSQYDRGSTLPRAEPRGNETKSPVTPPRQIVEPIPEYVPLPPSRSPSEAQKSSDHETGYDEEEDMVLVELPPRSSSTQRIEQGQRGEARAWWDDGNLSGSVKASERENAARDEGRKE